MNRAAWTSAEEERLRKLAISGITIGEIAAAMGRTSAAIRYRAIKMNIAIASARHPMQRRLGLGLRVKGK